MKKLLNKKTLFWILFVVVGFVTMQFPFTKLVGANVKFSLFDFYGPIAGGFLGSLPGMLTVLVMQLVNWAWHGFATNTATIIRFFPMLFAVLYFAKKSKWILIVPVVAMLNFWVNTETRTAWYFAFYWLIPIVMYFVYDKFLFARALGSTFTAHAVGSVFWVWAFNMKAALWIGLIPVVWKERVLMAAGICVTYVLFNYLFSWLETRAHVSLPFVKLNPKYSVK